MSWCPQVLIIASESLDRRKLERISAGFGVHIICCSTLIEAQPILSGNPISAVFAETPLPDGDLESILASVKQHRKLAPVVALIRPGTSTTRLAAIAAGAFECLSLPLNTADAKRVLWQALRACFTATHHELVAV